MQIGPNECRVKSFPALNGFGCQESDSESKNRQNKSEKKIKYPRQEWSSKRKFDWDDKSFKTENKSRTWPNKANCQNTSKGLIHENWKR